METKQVVNEVMQLLPTMKATLAEYKRLAAETEGKWINVASNGLVLEGYEYYENEEGRKVNRLGINGTGYTTRAEKAQLFDTEEEAYNAGNFYLIAIVEGKEKTIYVNARQAAPFFEKKVEELEDVITMIEKRLEELK